MSGKTPFWSHPRPFEQTAIASVPNGEGVYLICYKGKPYYLGYSKNLKTRLRVHRKGRGSRMVGKRIDEGWKFTFKYAELMSYQQVEAILLTSLRTVGFGNLRRETDPADRWKARDAKLKAK